MRKITLWLVMVLSVVLSAGFTWKLPELNVPQMSIIYDINGREVKGIYQQNRISVGLNQVSPYLIDAFIAVEDKNFYRHHGIDLGGVLRALLVDLRELRVVEGGSTITQQTAKNLFLTQERTLTRKIKELYYTFLLEKQYTKDEILEMYLNTIYFGNGAYGVEAAARTYFAKSASDLTLAESALLAGIPARPSRFNPFVNPEAAKSRQSVVLERMVEEGKISEEEAKRALRQPLQYRRARFIKGDAPYFADMVIDYLVKKYGARMVYQGGLKIYTGLDLDMQEAAQEAYDDTMKDKDKDLQAALVAVDARSGYIKAMIGGRDFAQSQFNRAINAYRQPGSAFKPFLYSLAIEEGYTAASTFTCDWVEFPQPDGTVYRPTDYGDQPYHYRDFTLKEAIMVSDNVVSVKLNNSVGPKRFAEWAKKFGFSGKIRPVLSLALGTSEVTPLEMASALTAFANGGVRAEPVAIIKVLDRNGQVLEEHHPRQSRLVSPENAYIITDMLEGVLEPGGTASHLKSLVGRPAAGKTGTTQEYRDAWFVGYTPQLSCAVWVGYDTQTRTVDLPGGRIAGPIWANFMRKASEKLPVEYFPVPDDIININICMDTGLVATESCPRVMKAAFVKGTEPNEMCYVHQSWWDLIPNTAIDFEP
ncbi:transglycosylase domain-containing protein [Syntrophothermus lipocalidus]|uniref:Penicillin-binding protein 1A n=1 Tax=Syntrophothermus lipocalidus (strain DSM 12680 / TGB-C1) TaxID=643648 RepID=D7CN50_SYNLT|nr:penicillin-binding protein 1A [Syntrophothermus lipocalidus]ADI02135.1 penicillin-binding protein, 1A family [Syntrophothermus lipocalidus DSM 12680]